MRPTSSFRASRLPRSLRGVFLVALVFSLICSPFGVDAAQKKTKKAPPKGAKVAKAPQAPAGMQLLTPVPFRERNGKEVFNASGIVALGDSHFLFADNRINDALMDFRLTVDGAQAQPITRVPLGSVASAAVDDIEGLALAEIGGRRFIFASPSFAIRAAKKKGAAAPQEHSALLRIAVGADGALSTEAMADFRSWLVKSVPMLAAAADTHPDTGGLNIEGFAWDAKRQALLFGIRTPLVDGLPVVVPVRLKEPAGAWTTANLEALEPIPLHIDRSAGPQGIRGMAPSADGTGFLVIVGNAMSGGAAPFAVYRWDGLSEGNVTRLPYAFEGKMKPEGLASGTVGGKPAFVVVDDGGGFIVVRKEERR